jgi:hypothetical protein
MRRPISLKSNTYTEVTEVDTTGISVKAGVHYPGKSARMQMSAEAE